ncbi:MAG: porin [Candidatus Omnitrophica bacterium]|nr:porin [Candidatus Omnitrophota bacterium]MBU4458055.1 porin [Candidatus Omnitrophota bacterium]
MLRKFLIIFTVVIMTLVGSSVTYAESDSITLDELEEKYPILGFFDDVELHGFVDTGYNYNFEQPSTQSNSLRVFDTKSDSFTLHMVELSLEKPLTEENLVGFRFDLNFGKDANVTAPADTDGSDEFDVQEAFVQLRAPVGNGIDFKIGKFVTLLGAEVIEAPLNYNYSRSFLFGYAIPFTHTGLLSSYEVNDTFSFSAGIVNGWDVIEDNNNAKTFLGNVVFAPVDYFSLGVNGVYGAEQASNDSSKRWVVDIVGTLTPLERLTFMLNYDYGEEEDVSGSTARWSGLAAYVHYDASDWVGFTVRSEFFNDNEGSRTGTVQDLWEVTLTSEFKIYKDALLRLEYRHDESNATPFTDDEGNSVDDQDTVGLEVAYIF